MDDRHVSRANPPTRAWAVWSAVDVEYAELKTELRRACSLLESIGLGPRLQALELQAETVTETGVLIHGIALQLSCEGCTQPER